MNFAELPISPALDGAGHCRGRSAACGAANPVPGRTWPAVPRERPRWRPAPPPGNTEPTPNLPATSRLGVNAVMVTTITATIRQPRSNPSAPPRSRSTKLRPDFFITQRAVWPAIPAATATAKKIIRKPALSASQADFRYRSNQPASTLILPRRQQVSGHQARQVKCFLEKPRVCRLHRWTAARPR